MNFNSLLNEITNDSVDLQISNSNSNSKESIDYLVDDIINKRTHENESYVDTYNQSKQFYNLIEEQQKASSDVNVPTSSNSETQTYNIETSTQVKYIQYNPTMFSNISINDERKSLSKKNTPLMNQEKQLKNVKSISSIKKLEMNKVLTITYTDKFNLNSENEETFSPKLKINNITKIHHISSMKKFFDSNDQIIRFFPSKCFSFEILGSEVSLNKLNNFIINIADLKDENKELKDENISYKNNLNKLYEDNKILFSKLKHEQELRTKDKAIINSQKKTINSLNELIKNIKLNLNTTTSTSKINSRLLSSESNISLSITDSKKDKKIEDKSIMTNKSGISKNKINGIVIKGLIESSSQVKFIPSINSSKNLDEINQKADNLNIRKKLKDRNLISFQFNEKIEDISIVKKSKNDSYSSDKGKIMIYGEQPKEKKIITLKRPKAKVLF